MLSERGVGVTLVRTRKARARVLSLSQMQQAHAASLSLMRRWITCKLTDVHRQVQALAIEKPKEDDVTVLVRMSNCSISRSGLVS